MKIIFKTIIVTAILIPILFVIMLGLGWVLNKLPMWSFPIIIIILLGIWVYDVAVKDESDKNKDKARKLLEDYERYLDNRILGKHNSRASKQLIDDYFENKNNIK